MRLAAILLLCTAGFLLVAGETLREASNIQLAGELDVGFELISKCSSLLYEGGQLCSGRKPYTLYGDSTTGCSGYFWCSPEHAACVMACPSGAIFNQACNCCQDSATAAAAAFDVNTCSTVAATAAEQQSPRDNPAPARKLLADGSSSSHNELAPRVTERQMRTARAQARLAMRRRRAEARLKQATAAATDSESLSSDGQPPVAKRTMARRNGRTGEWTSSGKKYSGRWADKAVVKEPAVRVPSTTAAGSKPSSAAVAEAVTESAAVAGTARHLLVTEPAAVTAALSASSSASADALDRVSTIRALKMKRALPLAVQTVAAAAAAGERTGTPPTADAMEPKAVGGEHHKLHLRQPVRPMDKKPAAKSIDPEDEKEAPFAAALAALPQRHEPHQLGHAQGM